MASRILVAIDESPQSWAALEHALETFPDADITVLHVNDPMEWVYGDEMGGYVSEAAYERAEASAEELLARAEDEAAEHGATVETDTALGRAANTIVEYAEEHGADHVVVGSHGRTGLSRILLGSVAEGVVRRSPVTVTVVREEVDEDGS